MRDLICSLIHKWLWIHPVPATRGTPNFKRDPQKGSDDPGFKPPSSGMARTAAVALIYTWPGKNKDGTWSRLEQNVQGGISVLGRCVGAWWTWKCCGNIWSWWSWSASPDQVCLLLRFSWAGPSCLDHAFLGQVRLEDSWNLFQPGILWSPENTIWRSHTTRSQAQVTLNTSETKPWSVFWWPSPTPYLSPTSHYDLSTKTQPHN